MDDASFLGRHGLFAGRAPLYASYPAATHFSPRVGAARAAEWLRAVPPGATLSAYVHVPFCRRLCWFCACRTQGAPTDAPLAPYVADLAREVEAVAALLPEGVTLGRLHLGGGTPTILPPALLAALGAAIAARLPAAPGAEISVEVDPKGLGEDRLDALAALGIARAAIGLQDLSPRVQAAIGRAQGAAGTRAAVEGLRARGVRGLDIELLYGLPHQTEASLLATVEVALGLFPDRIALHGYAHVPWAARRQVMIPEGALPSGPARLALSEAARARLLSAGFEVVGLDHFARPGDALARAAREGRLRRTFQGCTDDPAETLLGFGASAISRFAQGFAQNAGGTADWAARVRAGGLGAARGHALTGRDRLEGALIEALLCDLAADPGAVAARAGAEKAEAAALIAATLARWPEAMRPRPGGGAEIAPRARPLARLIAQGIDAYDGPAHRHAAAV